MLKLLKIHQVAEQLSVSPLTVRKWVKTGKVPIVRLGRAIRVREEDLHALMRVGYEPPMRRRAAGGAQ